MRLLLRFLGACALPAALCILGSGCSKEGKIARHSERANAYFQAGELDKAEIEYVNTLRLDPQHKASIARLGLIYFDQGKPAHAFGFLKRTEELSPENLDVRLKLASIYMGSRSFNDARSEANYILEKDPANAEALVVLADSAHTPNEIAQTRLRLEQLRPQLSHKPEFQVAWGTLAYRERKLAEAESAFQEALHVDPKSVLAYSALANLSSLVGKPKEAERAFRAAYDLSPPRSSRRIDYIDFKLRSGDIATARQLLEETTRNAPDYVPALNRLAELALGEKKFKEARAFMTKVLIRDPQNFEALMLEGRLQFAQGNTDKASSQFQRLRGLFPRLPQPLFHLAIVQLAKNDTTEAISRLREAVSLDPDYPEAVLLLAELNLRKGDALSAITALRELMKKRPELPQTYLLLASAHRSRNSFEDAMGVYQKFIDSFPKNPQPAFLMGTVHLAQNRTNQARQSFERALELAPNYLPAIEQLINLDLIEKKFTSALERIGKEQEKHPRAPELQILLAKTFFEQGKTNQVEQTLLKAIELDPNYREPYVLLASYYVQQKQHQQAIARLESVVARNPKDVGALMLLGVIHRELQNWKAERDAYEKLLAANPRFSPALNNLAYLYSEHFNDLEKAYQMAQKARELLPFDPATADTLGWILFKRQEYTWALSLLQESADRLTDQPEVLFHLGMAHYMVGQEEPSRGAFNRALEIKKDFPGKNQCVRRLAILNLDRESTDAKLVPFLESEVKQDSRDPVALSRLATVYERVGAVDKARRAYEQALAISPQNVIVLVALAELSAEKLGNHKRAMELAKTARSLAPDDVSITHTLGRLASQTGDTADLDWSLSLLQETARRLPSNPQVIFDLAWSHYLSGRTVEAESEANAALKTGRPFPDSDSARRLLHFAALARNMAALKTSQNEITDCLSREPDYLPALFAAGLLREDEGQPNEAADLYRRVLDRYPVFTPAHKRLAQLYLDAIPNVQRAYDHAYRARERQPGDAEAAKLLGIAAFKRGDFAKSAQLLKESSKNRPNDAELFYFLGLAHYRLKQTDASKKALDQALALKLPSSMAEEAKRLMPELN